MTGTAVINYSEKLAEQAAALASHEKTRSGTFLSTKGGVLSFEGEAMPGNQACVIVIDSIWENTFYEGKYDPDLAASPLCYALGRAGEDMAPHPSMAQFPEYFAPQHEQCQGCPKNEWGSADTGKGKACQNRRRLVLLPAGLYKPKKGSRDFDLDLFDDPDHFESADVAFLKLPATSVSYEWAPYVTQLSAAHRLPPHGVITRVFIEPHPKHQFHIKFEMIEKVPEELLGAIMQRHDAATLAPISGYQPPEEKETGGSIKGLRRR